MTDAAFPPANARAETEALPPRRRGRLLQALRKDRKLTVKNLQKCV